jgi:1-acyl-sn-glycerol-3-phosphate acyltransferase
VSARVSDPPFTARLPAWLRVPYEYAAFAFALAFFGVGGLAYTLVGPVLYYLLPRRIGSRVGQSLMTGLFRMYLGLLQNLGLLRLDVADLDRLRGERSLVLAPNHPSMLDAVLVISRLPDTTCIMKAEIHDNPFLGGGAKLAGYIRNDTPVRMIKRAADEVRAGRLLLVFPEGTRTVQHPVNPFKGSFALVAREARAPVQTLLIETDSPYLAKGWPLLRKPPFPMSYRVRLGRRFEPTDDTRTLMASVETYFHQSLGEK